RTESSSTMNMDKTTRRDRSRVGVVIVGVLVFLFATVIVARLVNVQLIQHGETARQAAALHYQDIADYPERGEIIASNGTKLAVTTYVYTIGLTPRDLESAVSNEITRDDIVSTMAEILELPREEVAEAAAQVEATYVLLKKEVPRETYQELKEYLQKHQIGGVSVDTDMKRYYPQPDLAPEVIGFTNKREHNIEGVIGLESFYNETLAGTPGFRYGEVDNYSKSELYFSEGMMQKPRPGNNIVLHLNPEIQQVLEQELESINRIYNNSEGAAGIVMNIKTGAILAMGQTGSFDPNEPMAEPQGLTAEEIADWDPVNNEDQTDLLTSKIWLNRNVSEPYEPGSTYKALTVSIALEEKAVSETELFSDAPIKVEGWDEYPVRCSIYPANHGEETMEQALWYSCNPVMVQIAQRIGVETYYDYVQAFGHRGVSGIDLPAETVGLIHEDPSTVDLAIWSFGEQSTVTPIQLLNSFAALGNGGILMQPQVVDYMTDRSGNVVADVQPEVIRRVISEQTSDKIMEYMRGVVTDGTAGAAEVYGYQPAGKTSTSSHGEDDEFVVVSFCGIAPYDNPEVAALIIMYEPTPITTSQPAQYVYSRVMERTLKTLGLKPDYNDTDYYNLMHGKMMQPYEGSTLYDAQTNAVSNSLHIEVNPGADFNPWSDDKVVYQYPEARKNITGRGFVYLTTDPAQKDLAQVAVPDFSNLTMSECLDLAEQSRLNILFTGGNPRRTIVQQDIEAGDMVPKYTIIELEFGY
ncbi:MAG TPA: hypothetical protein GX717_02670, partial [Clostridiaceae bacterium]|nr:hypothetical protein [Clostridiaceae bacterium]